MNRVLSLLFLVRIALSQDWIPVSDLRLCVLQDVLSYCKHFGWKHRYLFPGCCLEQDAAALSRYCQISREEIKTSCFILASAKIQLRSGKSINGCLGLQLKEKQMWELSTQHQIVSSFSVRRQLWAAHLCLSPNDVWPPACSSFRHSCAMGSIPCSLCGRWCLGRDEKGGREWRRMEFCGGHSSPYMFGLGVGCAWLIGSWDEGIQVF